jgi:hypothetical protein
VDEEKRAAYRAMSAAMIREAEADLDARGMLDRDIDSLSDEERAELEEPELLALCWRQHLRLYPEWEAYREEGEYQGMNPRLHIVAHVVAERRIQNPDWPYRAQFEELMREGASRHDAIHHLGADVAREVWETLRGESD